MQTHNPTESFTPPDPQHTSINTKHKRQCSHPHHIPNNSALSGCPPTRTPSHIRGSSPTPCPHVYKIGDQNKEKNPHSQPLILTNITYNATHDNNFTPFISVPTVTRPLPNRRPIPPVHYRMHLHKPKRAGTDIDYKTPVQFTYRSSQRQETRTSRYSTW